MTDKQQLPSNHMAEIRKIAPASLSLLMLIFSVTACTDNTPGKSSEIVRSDSSVELAIIGDVPYDDAEIAEFPSLIEAINDDPFVTSVVHVGDIKSGESECSDQRYWDVFWSFLTFKESLVYTIGDNEWTDCDRVTAGQYDPEERLVKLREIFFDLPGTTLGGGDMQVEAQSAYPENQLWQKQDIVFGTLHLVGSNNNFKSETGATLPSQQTASQSSEYGRRNAANTTWLRNIFDRAIDNEAAGLVLFFHADMWKLQEQFDPKNFDGFTEIVQELSILAEAFGKPVLFVSGDNHHFRVDVGVEWFSLYGVSPVSNVTQIILERGIELTSDGQSARQTWLRLVADASSEDVFSWELVSKNSPQ
jgi:hypothetical protein